VLLSVGSGAARVNIIIKWYTYTPTLQCSFYSMDAIHKRDRVRKLAIPRVGNRGLAHVYVRFNIPLELKIYLNI